MVCRDGGLKDNNPIQIAINEAKTIWRTGATFDAIVSIGSGKSTTNPEYPVIEGIVPDWLTTLVHSFMSTLNGEEYWKDFEMRSEQPIKLRARRLNVHFQNSREPSLDDFSEVDSMKAEANKFPFYKSVSEISFTKPATKKMIDEVALQLRASLFFFQPRQISYSKDKGVATVEGLICCRLDSCSQAFRKLHDLTASFEIPGPPVTLPPVSECIPRFLLKISFQHDTRLSKQSVQIEVQFKEGYSVPISGFPTTFNVRIQNVEKNKAFC